MWSHLQGVEERTPFPVHWFGCHHTGHQSAEDRWAAEKQRGCVLYWLLPPKGKSRSRGSLLGYIPPDIEAMVGVWCVLGPLEQGPLKLDGDLGDGVGWQLNQHLQEVGLLPVLGRLVVDVTWMEARTHRLRS